MYIIKCVKCGHVKTINQKWIAAHVPDNIKGNNIKKWLKDRLKCNHCNSKHPTIKPVCKRNKKIERLLNNSNWLYQQEIDIILRFENKIKNGYSLSKNQDQLLNEISSRIENRKSVRAVFFRG